MSDKFDVVSVVNGRLAKIHTRKPLSFEQCEAFVLTQKLPNLAIVQEIDLSSSGWENITETTEH